MMQEGSRLEMEIDKAVMQERERMVRDLHDTVVPKIYSLGLYLEALELALRAGKRDSVTKTMAELRATAKESLTDLRVIMLGLTPPILDDASLAEALGSMLASIEARHGIHTELSVNGSISMKKDVQLALYRIVQEAVNNVLKHAEAKMLIVQLQTSNGKFSLTVKDDGKGFDLLASENGGGLGLRNIRRRANTVNASLVIDTAPGKGTLIYLISQTDRSCS